MTVDRWKGIFVSYVIRRMAVFEKAKLICIVLKKVQSTSDNIYMIIAYILI